VSPTPDSYDEMHFLPGVDDTAERLLSRRLSAEDAPASYSGMAALFEAVRAPASSSELRAQGSVVAAMLAEVRNSAPAPGPVIPRRRSVLSKILTAKVAAAAAVAVFGVGTAAAAAAGSLPGQTSNANGHAAAGLMTAASHTAAGANNASNGKSHGKGHSGSTAGSSSPSSIPTTGPANSHAQFGLCQAFLAAQGSSSTSSSTSNPPQYNSTAFQALIGQHGGVAATTTYCHGVVTAHSSTDNANGDSTDTGKPANRGKPADAGQPPITTGKPASTPASTHSQAPVSTPNSGGTSTANTASGGASSTGTSTANNASGGASSAGSGNAPPHR
jgi:hypothetical protein